MADPRQIMSLFHRPFPDGFRISDILNNNKFPTFRYEPGDHVAIYPENNKSTVEKIGKRLNVDLDTVISLDCIDG